MASLLDNLVSADGQPSANYVQGTGRTVGKVRRVTYREPSASIPKPSFRVDVEILKSTIDKHAAQVGFTATVNLGFRFPEPDLARMRRMLAAMATSAEGEVVSEATAASRVKEFIGDAQPLTGAVITIVSLSEPQKGDKNKTFTKFEIEVPSDADLDGIDL